ncbi:protein kinase domain-containing protein [Floridanema evergladense]|uniref:Protein kinase n=1 Tax=Floridaenema evergladense BLCC-F167 TaxID=3153639 RepID=A0ABV4WKH1_9CYAN
MICCLNPNCKQPLNPPGRKVCQNCGSKLEPLLRNRYRVIKPIGQGGFGRTYLAADRDMLNASCVIKQFSVQSQGTQSQEKAIELFNKEAYRLHELGVHPQIPTLLAYFEQDKRLYLVQQFIEGQNLYQELVQQGVFGEEKIREVLRDILPVLKFVHERQVIHRDITPTNIIRRKNDRRLVLIDFGIAKQITESTASLPGTKIGTEGYAPLEQLRNGQVFPASDIYSLGATCIYLMTKEKPDSLYNPLNGQWIWRDYLRKKGSDVSDNLTQILDKMLKDWVNERYQSADLVWQDLNVVGWQTATPKNPTSAKPSTATPPPTSARQPAPNPGVSGSLNINKTPVATPVAPGRSIRRPITPPPVSRQPNSNSAKRIWRCINTLNGHTSWVMAVAISANKQVIASGGLDDQIKVWSSQTGELLHNLSGHTKAVNSLTISPDSLILVSGSDDEKIKLWNLHTATLMQTLTEHSRDVNAVAISPDGQILVSGGDDRTIKLWRLKNGLPIRTLFASAGMIKAIAIDPKGDLIATGGLDNQIKLWKLATGELVNTLYGHFNSVYAVAFSPDGGMLASASKDKTVKLWNTQTGELIRTFSGHTGYVNGVQISPDGQTLVSASSDKTIRIWRLETGELLSTLSEHTSAVNALAMSVDGQLIVSASSDKTVKIWQGFG